MRFLFSICIGLILSGCTAVRTGNPAQLTLLTYNVRNAKGLDNQTNYDQTAAVIRGSGAGIVALQELDSATTRSKGSVVLDSLAAKTGMHAVYGAAIEFQGGRYGVGLLLGSDAPQVFDVPGFSTHQELQYLVDAGLTPYEALKTGTMNVGVFYQKPNEMGVIKEGAYGDVVLVNANPLENIANTQKIEGVLVGNRWMNRAALDDMLKKLEKN